jgi:hypothetical protein
MSGRASAGADAPAQQLAKNAGLALLICLMALTGLRLAANAFADTDLFFDEAQYWFWSRELAFGYYSKPPLIGWIIRGATEICGQGEACIRAPSALFHAATALLVYAIGRTLYDARIGFWSGLTYATLPSATPDASSTADDHGASWCDAMTTHSSDAPGSVATTLWVVTDDRSASTWRRASTGPSAIASSTTWLSAADNQMPGIGRGTPS